MRIFHHMVNLSICNIILILTSKLKKLTSLKGEYYKRMIRSLERGYVEMKPIRYFDNLIKF